MGADGARRVVHPCGDQQYQQHRGDIARSVEAQVDHVEMPAGNKNLMCLIANGADSAKEQHGHATGAYTPWTPGKADHDHRSEQSDEEKLYGMGDATDVCAYPHANGSKSTRPDIRGSRIGAPGYSVLRLSFARGIGSLNARSLTLHHTCGGLAQQRRLHRVLLRKHPDTCQRCGEQSDRDPPDYFLRVRQRTTSVFLNMSECSLNSSVVVAKFESQQEATEMPSPNPPRASSDRTSPRTHPGALPLGCG